MDRGLPHGAAVAIGVCAFVAGLIAQIRTMSLSDWLEAALGAVSKLVALIAALVGLIAGAIAGLFW